MSDIKFTKQDVTVEEYELGDCANCSVPMRGPAFYISLDFRRAGSQTAFGEELYCSTACAEEVAGRIRESLPDED